MTIALARDSEPKTIYYDVLGVSYALARNVLLTYLVLVAFC